MDKNQLAFWHYAGCTPTDMTKILQHQKAHDTIIHCSVQKLMNIGIPEERAQRVVQNFSSEKRTGEHDFLAEKVKSLNVSIIDFTEPEYPSLLRQLKKPPPLLYVRGIIPKSSLLLSVVGSRRMLVSTQKSLQNILPHFTQSGGEIVSGGALGVDIVSHQIALENKSPTHVIYGSGIDVPYPSKHANIYEKIVASGGSLISPFALGTQPERYNFPIRNSLVAGMSQGVLVAQAGLKSGTLITARLALEQSRDVFVLPGDSSDLLTIGSNTLIKEGLGKMVLSHHDILGEWGYTSSASESVTHQEPTFTSEKEKQVCQSLRAGHTNVGTIVEATQFSLAEIETTLMQLELGGHIQRGIGGVYEVM